MFGCSIWLLKYILPSLGQTSRVEAVTKSPQVTMMSESGNGQTTIRAFSKQKEFISKNYEVINKNLLVYQIEVGCWMWYGVRMNFLSVVMMSVSCFVCIWYRESEDPVLMAMVFTYII